MVHSALLVFVSEEEGERDDRHEEQCQREIATPRVRRKRDGADEREGGNRQSDTDASGTDVPVPTVAVTQTAVPNAFTVGGPRSATIVVSTGLLESLGEDELDAVLAHELAHIKNRDAMVMTLATFVPSLAGDYSLLRDLGLSQSARYTVWSVALALLYVPSATVIDAPLFSLQYTLLFGLLVACLVLFGGVALGIVAMPVVSLASRLSHDREFIADRAGAVLAGSPASMASALRTLTEDENFPEQDARAVGGVRQLCFLPGGFGTETGDSDLESLPISVQSHPSTDERIASLRALEAEN
ncbi:heat shock protein HtpX [Haladaptatus litoreus]|uniref:Heat shock protein HtpX n=1 Tax=Haladaptatus litoreus TaxID=553468 RepID=A0A1N7E3A1_9EURY|nr:heat shock protein HtpX [Haladaptatus litoreus]